MHDSLGAGCNFVVGVGAVLSNVGRRMVPGGGHSGELGCAEDREVGTEIFVLVIASIESSNLFGSKVVTVNGRMRIHRIANLLKVDVEMTLARWHDIKIDVVVEQAISLVAMKCVFDGVEKWLDTIDGGEDGVGEVKSDEGWSLLSIHHG